MESLPAVIHLLGSNLMTNQIWVYSKGYSECIVIYIVFIIIVSNSDTCDNVIDYIVLVVKLGRYIMLKSKYLLFK